MSFESVRLAYDSRVAEYIEAVGKIEHAAQADRDRVLRWAESVEGRIIDVGSGPGQWTDYLRRQGIDIEGIEPAPRFLVAARDRYPHSRFHEGRAESLGLAAGSIGGVLAWYSLIHLSPSAMEAPLEEFARVIGPRGSLMLGFFTGAELAPFEHAVVTAFYWPAALLAEKVESAGFTVDEVRTRFDPQSRPEPGKRPEAILIATRASV